MVHVGLSDDSKLVLSDPSPEPDWLVDLTVLELCLGVKVEHLDHCLGALSSSQCDDVLSPVHEDTLSLHWLALKSEVFGRVNDGTILKREQINKSDVDQKKI